jgi:hypothetical protein
VRVRRDGNGGGEGGWHGRTTLFGGGGQAGLGPKGNDQRNNGIIMGLAGDGVWIWERGEASCWVGGKWLKWVKGLVGQARLSSGRSWRRGRGIGIGSVKCPRLQVRHP